MVLRQLHRETTPWSPNFDNGAFRPYICFLFYWNILLLVAKTHGRRSGSALKTTLRQILVTAGDCAREPYAVTPFDFVGREYSYCICIQTIEWISHAN